MPDLMRDLLSLEGNIPTILEVKNSGRTYKKDLERRIEMGSESVKRAVDFLLERQFITEEPYDGKVPNVKSWLVLTPLGEEVADCLEECRRHLLKLTH